eukprot:m.41706 g.41706  ORF g.41706 m.41706 type:complete len:182 (+) comp9801_c0_seq2:80-625(+)
MESSQEPILVEVKRSLLESESPSTKRQKQDEVASPKEGNEKDSSSSDDETGSDEDSNESKSTAITGKVADIYSQASMGLAGFPLARIKTVMKSDQATLNVQAEAVQVMSYATELFMKQLVVKAFGEGQLSKHSTIPYESLAEVVDREERYAFLADIVPRKVRFGDVVDDDEDQGDGESNGE